MRRKFMTALSLALVVVATPSGAADLDFGTTEGARAMLVRAVAAMKSDSRDAIARFNHNEEAFRDRDLFVFCFGRKDGQFTAHEAFVGRNIREISDSEGKRPFETMSRVAREGETDEVTFSSTVPGSRKHAERLAYVTAIGDQVCGVSAYQFPVSTARK